MWPCGVTWGDDRAMCWLHVLCTEATQDARPCAWTPPPGAGTRECAHIRGSLSAEFFALSPCRCHREQSVSPSLPGQQCARHGGTLQLRRFTPCCGRVKVAVIHMAAFAF
ncbi:hypothetical protein NDU88_000678 [Pleurodeles waltl]|uniref:Uncharacterized protein n=1 Tax=Pleurodeles waltl TaxID=8319 RepID=A0AAV7RAG7_PLEWA|nr:hypothetical protein NDU88_000678 [Pleurodeles waltl]